MKTLLEKTLNDIGIRTRDENNVLRSAEELTEDVMALLAQCDEENAGRLLFMIAAARHIEDAGDEIAKRRY